MPRVYQALRKAVERYGGSMEFVREGSPYGVWVVRIGQWEHVFPGVGKYFPGLDDMHVPLVDNPKTYSDYSGELAAGAIGRFVSSIVGDGGVSPRRWTQEEIECVVFCYFWMLDEQAEGATFNKAAVYRALSETGLRVNQRSSKAAERKFRNVSAVLQEAGLDWVGGLLPDAHCQQALRERVLQQLKRREQSEAQIEVEDTGTATSSRSVGSGFGSDAEANRAIELHAMAMAQAHYEAGGWRVTDTSEGHPYDLLCERDGELLYIEVKGTVGSGDVVTVTYNEVEHAKAHSDQCVLFVVFGCMISRVDGRPAVSGGEVRIMQQWDPGGQGTLKPISYRYTLPDSS